MFPVVVAVGAVGAIALVGFCANAINKWVQSMKEECPNCQEINFVNRFSCDYCDTSFVWCSKCYNPTLMSWVHEPLEMCMRCQSKCQQSVPLFKVVKSSHIGGHRIIRHCSRVTSTECDDQDSAVDELKYLGVLFGGNALINLKIHRYKNEDGNYIYSTWKASGDVVEIVKT